MKQDIAQSVDYFNRWFITFAPEAFRAAREGTIERTQQTLQICADLRAITPEALKQKPDTSQYYACVRRHRSQSIA